MRGPPALVRAEQLPAVPIPPAADARLRLFVLVPLGAVSITFQ